LQKFPIIESLFRALFRHEVVRSFFTIFSSSYLLFIFREPVSETSTTATNARACTRGKWLDTLGYKFLVIKDAVETETFIIERFLVLRVH